MSEQQQNMLKRFRYREEAMATHFEIYIVHQEQQVADSVAGMAFRELDRLEDLLSRFRDGSDIARINQMIDGETILISPECHECLRQGMEIQLLTDAHFDIATGGFMELLRDLEGNPVQAEEAEWDRARKAREQGALKIDPEEARVSCDKAGLQLDLGGIGKGYALEALTELFEELEVTDYLLSSGGSTLLARGNDECGNPWTSGLSGAQQSFDIELIDQSVSGSGFEVKGAHIIDSGSKMQEALWRRVWVVGPHAALVDGLSTACFQMKQSEIEKMLTSFEDQVRVWVETHEGEIQEIG